MARARPAFRPSRRVGYWRRKRCGGMSCEARRQALRSAKGAFAGRRSILSERLMGFQAVCRHALIPNCHAVRSRCSCCPACLARGRRAAGGAIRAGLADPGQAGPAACGAPCAHAGCKCEGKARPKAGHRGEATARSGISPATLGTRAASTVPSSAVQRADGIGADRCRADTDANTDAFRAAAHRDPRDGSFAASAG